MSEKITENVYLKIKNCINQHGMLSPGENIIACVSGGCDSVAMLFFLYRYAKEEGLGRQIICAHFDHMLRGEESDGDRLFVENLCKKLNVEFCCKRQDASAYSEEKGLSLEAGARELRYSFFQDLAKEKDGKISVAHNSDDKVETILLNIARGTGIHGLKGISYTRDNIIRPLLDVTRAELEQTLEEMHIEYRTDSTNKEAFCKRNKLRLEVLPYLRENFTGDIDSKLLRLSGLATEDNDYLDQVAREHFTRMVKCQDSLVIIDNKNFKNLHRAVKNRVCGMILKEFYSGGAGITMTTVNQLNQALETEGAGYSGEVGKGLLVRVYHDRVILGRGQMQAEHQSRGNITVRQCDTEEALEEGRKPGSLCAAFDKELLEAYCKERGAHWEIRNRQEGDRFTPMGCAGGKSLKKFLIDQKVPADKRDSIPLIACGKEILWIPGVRRSDKAPVSKRTVNALLFKYNI